MTTPSSFASGANACTAGCSFAGNAPWNQRSSWLVQKYGPWNSSDGRMTCAPLPAAWRISLAVFSMFGCNCSP